MLIIKKLLEFFNLFTFYLILAILHFTDVFNVSTLFFKHSDQHIICLYPLYIIIICFSFILFYCIIHKNINYERSVLIFLLSAILLFISISIYFCVTVTLIILPELIKFNEIIFRLTIIVCLVTNTIFVLGILPSMFDPLKKLIITKDEIIASYILPLAILSVATNDVYYLQYLIMITTLNILPEVIKKFIVNFYEAWKNKLKNKDPLTIFITGCLGFFLIKLILNSLDIFNRPALAEPSKGSYPQPEPRVTSRTIPLAKPPVNTSLAAMLRSPTVKEGVVVTVVGTLVGNAISGGVVIGRDAALEMYTQSLKENEAARVAAVRAQSMEERWGEKGVTVDTKEDSRPSSPQPTSPGGKGAGGDL